MTTPSTTSPQATRDVYYSIGTDQSRNLKERLAELHDGNSEVIKAVAELDRYIGDPQTRISPWYWNFYKKVKSAMSILYPHSNNVIRTQMASEFIDDIFNGGYVRALQCLSFESGGRYASFARDYAKSYAVPIGAGLLFGPKGAAYMELVHFIAAEKLRGLHRHGISPNPGLSEQTKKTWYAAEKTCNWSVITDKQGKQLPMDMIEEDAHLPESISDRLSELWRRNRALRNYTGSKRLSGDTAFQIVEDVVDMLIQSDGNLALLDEIHRARYNQIVEQANRDYVDPFYAVYENLFPADKDRLRPLWDKARNWLYEHSLSLWESQNKLRLAESNLTAFQGVSFYRAKNTRTLGLKRNKYGVPGTIFLNNGRYYWAVRNKMNPKPLIDPKSKPNLPGTIFKDGSRYYWFIPGLLKRQRLVPKGESFSTKDRAIAEEIVWRKWKQLKKENPELAQTILQRTRSQGLATKDRALAERIAARLCRRIKRQDPELAAKILKDNRPKVRDYWQARITVNGKFRHIGTYRTCREAQAAYTKEFEKVWGYPPGYNIKIIPKLDKVWPTWEQEKVRLERMDEHPRMPVIGRSGQTEALKPMVDRMQKVGWLTENVILVFDDNSPSASQEIASQSRGISWYEQIRQQGKRPVILGAASIDKDTGRIKITIYNQGFDNEQVLAEEIYHIAYKVIRYAKPKAFEAIQRWYQGQLKRGSDPTFSLADMFCCKMALEESGITTGLPRSVVRQAQNIFSPTSVIPNCLMQEVKATWSIP